MLCIDFSLRFSDGDLRTFRNVACYVSNHKLVAGKPSILESTEKRVGATLFK